MVIFDTISMLFCGVFLTKDVRHETNDLRQRTKGKGQKAKDKRHETFDFFEDYETTSPRDNE